MCNDSDRHKDQDDKIQAHGTLREARGLIVAPNAEKTYGYQGDVDEEDEDGEEEGDDEIWIIAIVNDALAAAAV